MKTTTADDGMNEGEDPATNENSKVRKRLATSDNELGDNVRGATRARKKRGMETMQLDQQRQAVSRTKQVWYSEHGR